MKISLAEFENICLTLKLTLNLRLNKKREEKEIISIIKRFRDELSEEEKIFVSGIAKWEKEKVSRKWNIFIMKTID